MTDPMTTPPLDLPGERLTALRDIANAATEGPWDQWNPSVGESHISIAHKVAWRSVESATSFEDDQEIPHWADATHIAAFDPPTVLALLDRAEAAERAVAAVRNIHRPAKFEDSDLRYCVYCDRDDRPAYYPCPTITALDGGA